MNPTKPSQLLLAALTLLGLFQFIEYPAWAQAPSVADSNQTITPLPEPPQQHLPWTPPLAGIDPDLLNHLTTLFELGMADPRGCDYRQIDVFNGKTRNNTITRVHGWVMPETLSSTNRYAVGWDGLVHPVLKIGPQAQLSSDMEYLLLAREALNRQMLANPLSGDFTLLRYPELYSLSETNPTDIKVALLLRLGEVDLARRYWQKQNAVSKTRKYLQNNNDPFFALAYNWVAAAFDRAVAMHLAGRDDVSLSDCLLLSGAKPVITGILDQKVQAKLLYWDKNPYFAFLHQLPELLADEQRRMANLQQRVKTLQAQHDQTPEQVKLEGLILNLENVAIIQGRDSWWGEDDAFNSIVAQGESAVEPLLQCLEQDTRLTRSVNARLGLMDSTFVSVREVAAVALSQILKVNFREPKDYKDYWQKYKNAPIEDRWFTTLQDDAARPEQWQNAAVNLLSRTDGVSVYLWGNAPAPKTTNRYTYKYADLRAKKNPSFSDLLTKRALGLPDKKDPNNGKEQNFIHSSAFCLMLAEWDPQHAATTMESVLKHGLSMAGTSPDLLSQTGGSILQMAKLANALAALDNFQGLEIYCAWLSTKKLERLLENHPESLSPLGIYPNNLVLRCFRWNDLVEWGNDT